MKEFIIGANYPWRHYGQDFGTSGWCYRGLASAKKELYREFSEIESVLGTGGKKVIRVFVFADGRSSPEFDSAGNVMGFDDFFFRDFDTLVHTAEQSRVQVMPVLLDFHWCRQGSVLEGVQLGGHSEVVAEPARRESFLKNALAPLLGRYGRCPEIFAWDLINEPEWVVRRFERPNGSSVDLESMRAFVRECTEMIHQEAGQPVTVGSARPQWLRYWRNLGLDLYQCHWYLGRLRLRLAALRAGIRTLDRPCLVGEAPTAGTGIQPAQYVRKAKREGYSGILFWSFRPNDSASDFSRVRI